MGESLVEVPKVENKMGESVTHVPCLQESVSFGRFQHDSLCWERWSTFPTNKYLEEVEKCSTPGSVAQKKAYFEAHYKKIAARKAELLDQERQRETEWMNSEDQSQTLMDSSSNSSEEELDIEQSNTPNSDCATELENKMVDFTEEVCHGHSDEPSDCIDIIDEENEVASFTEDVSGAHYDVSHDGDESGEITEEESEVANYMSEVSGAHFELPSGGIDMIEEDNEVENSTRDVSGAHLVLPSGGADIIEEDNEVAKFMHEVTDSHVDLPSGGVGIIEEDNEVANFTREVSGANFDLPSGGSDIVEDEKEVADFTSKITGAPSDVPNDGADITDEENEVTNVTIEASERIEEPYDGANVFEEKKDLQCQLENATDLSSKTESLELKPEEPGTMKEEASAAPVSQDKEQLDPKKVEKKRIVKKQPANVVKSETPKKMQKATPVKKTTNSTNAKIKPASPVPKRSAPPMPKSSMSSTPKSSKPVLSKTVTSTTCPLAKKENSITPRTDKKATRPETKRGLPTSLHMSVNLGPAKSDPAALTTTRKSLIMERMGDKDIVKRAFKAFQNSNQLSPSSFAKAPATNQSVTKKIEQKGSDRGTLQKKSEGILGSVKAASPHSGQLRPGKTSVSPGLRKTFGVEQRNSIATPASFGSRSLDHGNKQKEFLAKFSKKLEQKLETKEAEKTHLPSKLKAQKAAETRKPIHSINHKAKLSSSCNLGRVSKGLCKEYGKTEASG